MELGKLISMLEKEPPENIVHSGFGKPRSYRGYYDQVAFEPVAETTVGQMLQHALSALEGEFQGYKGGTYTYHRATEAWVAPWGECVDQPITEEQVARWLGIARIEPTADEFEKAACNLVVARRELARANQAIEKAQKQRESAMALADKAADALGDLLSETDEVRAVPVGQDVVVVTVHGKKADGSLVYNINVANAKGPVR